MTGQPLSYLVSQYQEMDAAGDFLTFSSSQLGGNCTITNSAVAGLIHMDSSHLAFLRRMIWERIQQGSNVRVTTNWVEDAKKYSVPSFEKRAVDILQCIKKRTIRWGLSITVFDAEDSNDPMHEFSTIACIDTKYGNNFVIEQELTFFLDYLEQRDWISKYATSGAVRVQLMPSGQIYLDQRARREGKSIQAFVAMWFSDETAGLFEDGILPAVEDAGYKAMRIDKHVHENRIDDEIIAQIRLSRFLIADFTCGVAKQGDEAEIAIVRGGVYFEAGFALGLGIPIIWTVREDRLPALHFDTRQYPHVPWKTAFDLREQLNARILALLGPGPGRDGHHT